MGVQACGQRERRHIEKAARHGVAQDFFVALEKIGLILCQPCQRRCVNSGGGHQHARAWQSGGQFLLQMRAPGQQTGKILRRVNGIALQPLGHALVHDGRLCQRALVKQPRFDTDQCAVVVKQGFQPLQGFERLAGNLYASVFQLVDAAFKRLQNLRFGIFAEQALRHDGADGTA